MTKNKPKKPNNIFPLESPNLQLSNASKLTKVRHRNGINLTFSKMPMAAKKVLFLMMAQCDTKEAFGKDVSIRVTAEDYARLCGIEKVTAYEQLKIAAIQLQQQVLEVPKNKLLPLIPRTPKEALAIGKNGKISDNDDDIVRMFNVTQWVDYSYDSGYIELSPSRQMEPYIVAINKDFTTQSLIVTLQFSDKNVSNMYQFICECMSSKSSPEFKDITVDDLKEKLGLFKTRYNKKIYAYPDYPIFKRDVINKSIKIINDQTQLKIACEVVGKQGRKAHVLRFSYSVDEQLKLDI